MTFFSREMNKHLIMYQQFKPLSDCKYDSYGSNSLSLNFKWISLLNNDTAEEHDVELLGSLKQGVVGYF